jgi:GMP synthase (glutamine-hydrolysing)
VTRAKRLWVIDPSIHYAEDECVERVLAGWQGERRVFRPSLSPGDGPGPGDAYDTDGVVVLGSSASVYDALGWLDDLSAWMKPLLDGSRRLPLLGICFGHQLVAHLAGARIGVLRADGGKEFGLRETCLEGGSLVPGRHDLRVVVSHREAVETLPHGYRVTARRPEVPIDGLEHDSLPVFTFQFHPEARREFVARRGLDPAAIDDRLVGDSDRLLDAFRRRVLSS